MLYFPNYFPLASFIGGGILILFADALINFFYSLLDNNEIRVEFLNYINKIVQVFPNPQNLNLKTLSDLVFLFCSASGFFMEEQILPNDDRVYEVICIYDKYRNALNEEYRIRIYKCLKRYVNRHVAIPKDIFSKIFFLAFSILLLSLLCI